MDITLLNAITPLNWETFCEKWTMNNNFNEINLTRVKMEIMFLFFEHSKHFFFVFRNWQEKTLQLNTEIVFSISLIE